MWKFTWFFVNMVMLVFLQHHVITSSAAIHLTPTMQKNALFQLKLSLVIGSPTPCSFDYEIPSHPKTMNWSMSSDYCSWEGVTCEHKTRDVIGLDLSCSQLEGAILPNSTLFQLSHLHFLNLSWNDFSLSNQFPQEFGFFVTGLTHLNLSKTQFSGRVPSGISQLYKLVSLDLSNKDDFMVSTELEYEVFRSLLQNLTQLRVLDLEGVDISFVLPMNLSTSLRVLNLKLTSLSGVLPQEVFHLPNLELLDLSENYDTLTATLPKVKWGSNSTLQHLNLGDINISGSIPNSIGFLESLLTLLLYNCNLSGPIPKSLVNLSQLTELQLHDNHLNGHIPNILANLTNLKVLDLSNNNLIGPFPSVAHNRELNEIEIRNNSLDGPLPTWLFELASLTTLGASYNGFTGQLHEFDSSKSKLILFTCGNNLLHGSIPQSFSRLVNIIYLDFSSNNFSGVLDMEMFSSLEYLDTLDLSHNSLQMRSTGMTTLPPQLSYLGLSSCNIKEFPHFLRAAKNLYSLDLSNNQIDGKFSDWIGSVGTTSLGDLNVSHNRLTGDLEQLPWNNIRSLDLQSNLLSGSFPSSICNLSSLYILNLSHNNLSGVLPLCLTSLTGLEVFDLQFNMLNGSLPSLICNSSSLSILNLSHNKLSGALPNCSPDMSFLSVIDLQMNNIQGSLPATLSKFRNLQSLNLHGNKLEGRIPSSFSEFDHLETLDLGSNQINDTFPRCLESLPNLQVLVLKSNKFHGIINKSSKVEDPFPSLRIIDLSYNEFSGPLPAIYFKNFKAMMNGEVNKIKSVYMEQQYYTDSTVLVIKGLEIVLERILTVFTTIDLSRNNFEGEIPEYIGNLVSLRFLNLSQNHLTGPIPSSIGKLSLLESLDLSSNRLEGEIPPELTGIYTLERLNLSCNQLSGRIPQGSQFNTFDNDSYSGNLGLCGNPLSKECEPDIVMQTQDEDRNDDCFFDGFTWEAVVVGYGCGVVPAFIIGYFMLLAGTPKWFAGIIARELGLKIRRMEIRWR